VNILAIDQGTSATKALVAGPGGEVLGSAEVPVHPRSVPGGGVEQDPAELYESVLAAGQAALARSQAPVHALALANQGETVLAWDRRTGRALTPAIVWQDRRSAGVCARLASQAGQLTEITGLPLDPYFAAPKMTWLRENVTGAGVVTTTDSWLLAQLGVGYLTDATTASRTLLLDLDKVGWSAAACRTFGIDMAELPEVADCAGVSGETTAFGPPLPVAGLAVDQQAALLAEGCFAPGEAKCTYGTGAFLLVTTGPDAVRSAHGLSASVAWRLGGAATYCLDGQVYTAGAALNWLAGLGLLAGPTDLDAAGGSAPDSGGVTFLPALAGLGAPHWRPDARGAFLGLSLGTTTAHLARAVAEGIAASVALLARAVTADRGAPLTVLRVDGGLTRSRLLVQAQADLLQVPVQVCAASDATALGAAALARLGTGAAGTLAEAVGPAGVEEIIDPAITADQAAERLDAFDSNLRTVLAAREPVPAGEEAR
jgi:glycerol kinase